MKKIGPMQLFTIFCHLPLVFFFLALAVYDFNNSSTGYKQGQVDALTGKVKYQLVENEDKTKEWKLIDRKENE